MLRPEAEASLFLQDRHFVQDDTPLHFTMHAVREVLILSVTCNPDFYS